MMDEAVTKDLMALLGPEPRPWVLHAVAWGIDSSMHEWFPMMWRNGLPNHRRWKLQSGDIYPVLEFREDDFGTRPNTTRHHNIEVKVTDLPHVRFWDRDDDIEVTFASRPPLTWIRPYYSWEEHGRYFSSHTALYRLWDRRHVRTKVMVGIETDRSLWVHALTAAGYQVYGINPLAVSRYRDRHNLAGAKSDQGDAKVLADLVRTDRHNHRPIAGDSPDVEGVRVLARAIRI